MKCTVSSPAAAGGGVAIGAANGLVAEGGNGCSTPPRGMAETEQRRLLEALAAAEGITARRDYALFHLMLATGIRVGSAVALEVEDVDLRVQPGY